MSVRKDEIQLSIEINGIKAGTNLPKIRQEVRDLRKELDGLDPASAAFIKKLDEIKKRENFLATVRAQMKGTAEEAKGLLQRMFPLVDVFVKGGVVAAAFFAVEKVAKWGKEVVKWAIEGTKAMEQSDIQLAATFKDASDIIEDSAKINAQAIGLTEEKFKDLTVTTGGLLNNLKFTREESAKMAGEVATLAGEISVFTGGTKTAAEVNEGLARGITGNLKSLKEYGILITETDVKNRLAAKGQNELTGSALKQAKAAATLELVMERTKDAQLAFAVSQDTIAQKGNRIGVFIDTLKDKLLRGLIPAFNAVIGVVADIVAPVKKGSDVIAEQIVHYQNLIETLRDVNLSEEARLDLINQLNTEFPELTKGQVNLNTSTEEYNRLLKEGTDELERRFVILGLQENLADAGKKVADLIIEEKEAAKKLTAAKGELDKIDPNVGFGEGRSVNSRQQAFKDATLAVNKYSGALDDIRAKEASARETLKDLTQIASEFGIDTNKILHPKDVITPDDPEIQNLEKILNERLKKREDEIDAERAQEEQALRKMVLVQEEFNDRLAIIDTNAEKKKLEARLTILKNSKDQEIVLNQQIADKSLEIDQETAKLSIDNTLRQIKEVGILQREVIRNTVTDVQDLQDALSNQALEEQIKSLDAQLAAKSSFDDDYLQLTEDRNAKEDQLHKNLLDQNERDYVDALEIRRNTLLVALNQEQLDEEDFNKEKKRINLDTDIAIKEAQVEQYKLGTAERALAERELSDLRKELNETTFLVPSDVANQGGSSSPEDDPRKKKRKELEDAAISTAQNAANAILEINSNRIDQELTAELAMIDAIERRKIEAAGDDAVLQKKIHAQAEHDRLEAEKRAARERKKIARSEAVIQGALAVVKALGNPFAVAAALIGTGIQLAVIDKQEFYKGGPTGSKGIYRDRSGHDVAGVVHTDEWVAPRHMVQDPRTGPVISYLENIRRNKGGFADGGFSTASTTPNVSFRSPVDTLNHSELAEIRDILREIRSITASWPTKIKATVAIVDIEEKSSELNYIRDQATA